MIQNFIFGILFSENTILVSGIQLFYIRPHISVDIIRVFLFFWFSSREPRRQQKLAKKITHFSIQSFSKDLTHFKNLNSLDIENNMQSQRSQKPFSLYKFSSQHFSVWCQKKRWQASFKELQELHSWSTLKVNVCIFLYIF